MERPGAGRVLIALLIASSCAVVLYTRVYRQFERVRIKVVKEQLRPVDGRVDVPLPDLSDLGHHAPAIVVRLQNEAAQPRDVAVLLDGAGLARISVPAARAIRADLSLPADDALAGAARISFDGDASGWSLDYLEIANVHGFSSAPLSLVIVPAVAAGHVAVPGAAAIALFLVLLAVALWSPRLAGPRWAQVGAALLAALALLIFAAALLSAVVTSFKVLLALPTFLECVALLFLPAIALVATRTAERVKEIDARTPLVALARLARRLRWAHLIALLYLATVALFLLYVSAFYEAGTGFTSLIQFGGNFNDRALAAVRDAPHHLEVDSWGYDGQWYAQLAVDPLLRDPRIDVALDNPPYRARRILFSWTAYILGLGQPAWILHAYAVQNILAYLLLALVLTRWFPPTNGRNLVLWFGCMFSDGLLASVRFALIEGPSLLLQAISMIAVETGWLWLGAALIGLSGLGRETNLLFGASLLDADGDRPWARRAGLLVGRGLLCGLPLVLWMTYVWYTGHGGERVDSLGFGNLSVPGSAYLEKWRLTIAELSADGWSSFARYNLMILIGITTQVGALIGWRRWRDPWWRIGALYALMAVTLGPAVWAGYPGAASRVLLPMNLAFNVVLLRERRGFWPLAVLGNASAIAAVDVVFSQLF